MEQVIKNQIKYQEKYRQKSKLNYHSTLKVAERLKSFYFFYYFLIFIDALFILE